MSVITIGTGTGITFENPYIGEAEINHIYMLYNGLTYMPGTIETFGNPALEVGDVVETTDKDGNTYKVLISSLDMNMSGGFSENITCSGTGNTEIQFSSQSPTERKIQQVYSNLQKAIAEASALINGAKGGIFEVTDSNGDGINDGWLLADNPDYTKATKFIRANYEGIGLSTDGGVTYKNAITHEGIVADAITTGKLSAIEIDNGGGFSVSADGTMQCKGATAEDIHIANGSIDLVDNGGLDSGKVISVSKKYGSALGSSVLRFYGEDINNAYFWGFGYYLQAGTYYIECNTSATQYQLSGNFKARAQAWDTSSLEELKDNIKKCKDTLDIVKNSEIYEYEYKNDIANDIHTKRYGFVIGQNRKTPDEVMSDNKDGVNTYSMCAILWKAVQEMSEQIESMQKRIDTLEEKLNG